MTQYSPTYVAILDLLFKIQADKVPVYKIEQAGGRFSRVKTEENSDRMAQDFYVAASELWSQCKSNEWYLVGRIAAELQKYNCLWYCSPEVKKSSSNLKAIRGLIKLGVIFKTETTDIYLINPVYIRRGEIFTVLNTTAGLLMNSAKITRDHICNRSPLAEANFTGEKMLLLTDS